MNFTENPVQSKQRERRLSAGTIAAHLDSGARVQRAGSGHFVRFGEFPRTENEPRIAGPQ